MPGYASLTDSEFDHWAKGVTLKRQLGTNPWDDRSGAGYTAEYKCQHLSVL